MHKNKELYEPLISPRGPKTLSKDNTFQHNLSGYVSRDLSLFSRAAADSSMCGDKKAVTYSGPTQIVIRSVKHDSTTAATHAKNLDDILNLNFMSEVTRSQLGNIKPILMITSDGGPDENPRYHKVISYAIQTFKAHNFDAVFWVTNALGRSAFNRVEHRMAPLSREPAGLILPHDHFGSHLNADGKTVVNVLERAIFFHAGKILSEVWDGIVIDSYPVKATFVEPGHAFKEPDEVSAQWKAAHVRESQYILQIVNCTNGNCCTPLHSQLHKILPTTFFPKSNPSSACKPSSLN